MLNHVRIAEGLKPNRALHYTVDLHADGTIAVTLFGGILDTHQARELSDALLRAIAMKEPFQQRIDQAQSEIDGIITTTEDDIYTLLEKMNTVDPMVTLLCPPPTEPWHGKATTHD